MFSLARRLLITTAATAALTGTLLAGSAAAAPLSLEPAEPAAPIATDGSGSSSGSSDILKALLGSTLSANYCWNQPQGCVYG